MSHEDPCVATETSVSMVEKAEPSGSRWHAIAALSILLIAAVLGLLASQLSLGRVDRMEAGSLGTSSFIGAIPSLVGLVAAMTMLVRRRIGDWWALAAAASGLMTFWLADYWYGREQYHQGFVGGPGLILGLLSGYGMMVASLMLLGYWQRHGDPWTSSQTEGRPRSLEPGRVASPPALVRKRAPSALWRVCGAAALGVVSALLPIDNHAPFGRDMFVLGIAPGLGVAAALVMLRRRRVGDLWSLTAAMGAWTCFFLSWWYVVVIAGPYELSRLRTVGPGFIVGLVSSISMVHASIALAIQRHHHGAWDPPDRAMCRGDLNERAVANPCHVAINRVSGPLDTDSSPRHPCKPAV